MYGLSRTASIRSAVSDRYGEMSHGRTGSTPDDRSAVSIDLASFDGDHALLADFSIASAIRLLITVSPLALIVSDYWRFPGPWSASTATSGCRRACQPPQRRCRA